MTNKSYDDWSYFPQSASPTTCQVHEADQQPQDSGLLDQHGNKLFSMKKKHPMGFIIS